MKKTILGASTIILCFLISCNSNKPGEMSDKAKKNLAAAQAVAKMFETGDYSKAGDYIATDAVDHAGMKGDVVGLDSIKAEFAQFSKTMSNMKNETEKELADDDYTFQWLKESGTMTADEMGMKAGQNYTFNAVEVSKFNKDGKLTDHWTFIEPADMMKMMPPPPPMEPKMDTAKNKMMGKKK